MERDVTEPPRATRAMSADGKWVVQLCQAPFYHEDHWAIYPANQRWDEPDLTERIPDSGQSADEVLAAWEKEQS